MKQMQSTRRMFLTPVILVIAMGAMTAHAEVLSFVLSGNATGDEIALPNGCTYTADPPYTNHRDDHNRKLIDRHRNTAGIDQPHQNVVFDLKVDCRIDTVSLEFTSNNKDQMPASVDVLLGDHPDGPWRKAGTLQKHQQKDNLWRLAVKTAHGRYLRLFHTRDKQRWFLSEVKIYGNIWPGQVGPIKRRGKALILADRTKAYATIVIPNHAPRNVLDAALACQNIVQKMTGVWLPIQSESTFKRNSAMILVGMSDLARKRAVNVNQSFRLGDHYVIRVGADYLALIGNDAQDLRGSAYAVYDLFQKLGCGWYGPDQLWQVIPTRDTLTIRPDDVETDQHPGFTMRNIWLVSPRRTGQELVDAWRLGKRWVYDAHAMKSLVPRKQYGQDHPDWFSNITERKWQPCFTHPEVIELVAGKLRHRIEREQKELIGISISPNDNPKFCNCQRCRSVGNRSARMLYFANALARNLRKTHPGRFILNFVAYWVTHAPPNPPITAEPEVSIAFVNEGNHIQPWSNPEPAHLAKRGRSNTREIRDFNGWKKTGVTMGIREWWIPGCKDKAWRAVPWYSGQTAILNLRYWQKAGVRYIHYETGYENNDPFPLRWPLYYVAARGLWDPAVTSDQVMREACDKLFGPASHHMFAFYHELEQAAAEQKLYGGKNWHLPPVHCIYSEKIVDAATRHLDQAAAAAAHDPKSLPRIRNQQKIWTNARKTIATERKKNRGKPTFPVTVDGNTLVYYKQPRMTPAMIRLLHCLPENTPLYVIENATKHLIKENEQIDLTRNSTFTTKP